MTADSPARTDARRSHRRPTSRAADRPGSEGDDAIDIAKLRAETGLITLDPGYVNTGACTSAITFIDGEEGILRYRGYPIEELAEHSTFLEVAYLLIWGELPTREQLDGSSTELTRHTLPRGDAALLRLVPDRRASDGGARVAAVAALSTFYPDSQNISTPMRSRSINRLIAKLPTLAAWSSSRRRSASRSSTRATTSATRRTSCT